MPMFPHAQNIQISGGQFNDVSGDQVNYYDNSKTDIRDSFNTRNNNFNNSFNDNSLRASGGSRYSTASSPGFRGGSDSPFGPGFPFNNPEKRSHSPFGRPSAPHRESEPAPAGRPRSPFDSTGLRPSAAEKVAKGLPTSGSSRGSSSSNISGSFNTNTKNISDAYNDYSVQTNNYNTFKSKNVTDSHDDNRDYSNNNYDHSYRDQRDQSTQGSFNRSSNKKEDRSVNKFQDFRDQSRPVDNSTSNDNRRYEDRSDNRKYDDRRYEDSSDNRKYDNRSYEDRSDNRRYNDRSDNRKYDDHSYNDSHNRPSMKTTNTDNSTNIPGGITNSGVLSPSPSDGRKSKNPFANYGAPPAERNARGDDDFTSNSHSERTSRSVTPKPATPRPNERRRSESPEGPRLQTPSPRRSSVERLPRAHTPTRDDLSYTDGSPTRSHLDLPVQNPPLSHSPDRMRTSPQPQSSHEDAAPRSPSPPPQAQAEQQRIEVNPAHNGNPDTRNNTIDNVSGMLNHLVVTPEKEEQPPADVASDASPLGKEKLRKRDKIKNIFSGHKKDKDAKDKDAKAAKVKV